MAKKRYIPSQEQFDTVINTLESVLKKYPLAKLRMGNTKINHCGSPMCHAGWYGVGANIDGMSYRDGSNKLAHDLGFKNDIELEVWADKNSDIWGSHGIGIFSSPEAFGLTDKTLTSLSQIIDYWRQVKERAKQYGIASKA